MLKVDSKQKLCSIEEKKKNSTLGIAIEFYSLSFLIKFWKRNSSRWCRQQEIDVEQDEIQTQTETNDVRYAK